MDNESPQSPADILKRKIYISRLTVSGLRKSKNDFITDLSEPVLDAKTVEEFADQASILRQKLKSLVAKAVSIELTDGQNPGESVVEIRLREKRLFDGGFNWFMGNEPDARLGIAAGVTVKGALPNIVGRGERLSYIWSKSTAALNSEFLLTKPLGKDKESSVSAGLILGNLSTFPLTCYKQLDKGLVIAATTFSSLGKHKLSWSGTARQLIPFEQQTFNEIREQAGHSLKSSIKHEWLLDNRNDILLPSRGYLLKLTNEIAGLGGDVNFISNEIATQLNIPLFSRCTLHLDCSVGHVRPFSLISSRHSGKTLTVMDKFFLGGPATVRGFEYKGVSVNATRPNAKSGVLGGDSYWSGCLALRIPLPGQGPFLDKFRFQAFLNAGNLVDFNSGLSLREHCNTQRVTCRLSYGVGIVTSMLGMARLELNYCIPARAFKEDRVIQGLQFGVTLS